MIKKIELKNFKCFESLELPLGNLNLLSGINSMGKSTIIQSLLLLRQAFERGSIQEGVYLNGIYTQIGTGHDLLYFNADGNIEIKLTDEKGDEFDWHLEYSRDSDYLYVQCDPMRGEKEAFENNLNLFSPDFEYIMAERLGPRKSYEKSFYDIQVRNHVGMHGEHAVYYLKKHAADEVGSESVVLGTGNKLKQQVERWMELITPGIQFDFDDVPAADIISLKVQQKENAALMGTIMDYKPVNVGFGISYSLPVVIALLKAKPDDLVILENPEAHLHPKGQRRIGELIARAAQGGAQILVETHSDHILNGIRLSVKQKRLDRKKTNLYYFHIEEQQGVAKHVFAKPVIDESGQLDFWPEGFFDEWDNMLLELL